MKYKTLIILALALMAFSGNGWTAMSDDDAEATIRLMGKAEAELPDAVTKEITLPQHLLDANKEDQNTAVENSAKGLKTANENRDKKHGNDASEQAQEARERGQEMSDKAKENRENRGRSKDRPDPPGRPDNPGQP